MPRYVIERQYLLPVYEQLLIEAFNLEAACREALDEDLHPWSEAAEEDFEGARAGTVTRAVELPDSEPFAPGTNNNPSRSNLGNALYSRGLKPLQIPTEFTDDAV